MPALREIAARDRILTFVGYQEEAAHSETCNCWWRARLVLLWVWQHGHAYLLLLRKGADASASERWHEIASSSLRPSWPFTNNEAGIPENFPFSAFFVQSKGLAPRLMFTDRR